jgi:rod shape-determining protein MreC
VVKDPDQDGFIKVIVKPAAHLDRIDEVLVITSVQPRFSPEQKQDIAASEAAKGAEAEEEKAQQKASEILGERLPGLLDPSLPSDQQPLNDTSNPNPVSRPPMAIHPDRFTPNTSDSNGLTVPGVGGSDATTEASPTAGAPSTATGSNGSRPASAAPAKKPKPPAPKPDDNATPQRNP